MPNDDPSTVLQKAYEQATENFRVLTKIRFQLLALLPVGTGLAAFLSKDTIMHPGIGLLGAATTVALWVYDERNNQHYDELALQAASLERKLGLFGGPFDARPAVWWTLLKGGWMVEHRWPIAMVYAMSLVVWIGNLLSFALGLSLGKHMDVTLGAWLLATGAVWAAGAILYSARKAQQNDLRDATLWAHEALAALPAGDAASEHVKARVMAAGELVGLSYGAVEDRLAYFLGLDPEIAKPPFREMVDGQVRSGPLGPAPAAHILAKIIDMPPRWIQDIAGRRSLGRSASKTGAPRVGIPLLLLFLGAVAVAYAVVRTEAAAGTARAASASEAPSLWANVPSLVSGFALSMSILVLIGGGVSLMRGRNSRGVRRAVAAGAIGVMVAPGLKTLVDSILKVEKLAPQLVLNFKPRPHPSTVPPVPSVSCPTVVLPPPSGSIAPPPVPRRQLFPVFSAGPFKSGLDQPENSVQFRQRLTNELLGDRCRVYVRLILVGQADARELTEETKRQFGTNIDLARARAVYTKKEIDDLYKTADQAHCRPTEAVFAWQAGPTNIGRPASELLDKDRSVSVFGDVIVDVPK